jgi:hypothetical protein
MSESDEPCISQISVRFSALPLDFHMVVLRAPGFRSDVWTLTVGSTDYLGRPDCPLPGPDCVENYPARITTLPADRIALNRSTPSPWTRREEFLA